MLPVRVIEWLILRWSIEVTFAEGRRHLGVETQRQWAAKTIARTTPALLALFFIVCLMVYRLLDHWASLPRSTAWCLKPQATFSDCLALVRRTIWAEGNDVNSLAGLDHKSTQGRPMWVCARKTMFCNGTATQGLNKVGGIMIKASLADQDQVVISRSAWERVLAQLAATA